MLRGRLLKLAPWRLLCWRSPGRLRDATQSCQAEQANVVPSESGADAGDNVAFHLLSDIEPCTGLGRVACWCVLGMAKTTSEDDAAQSNLLKLSRCSEYRRWTIDKAANASSGWLLSPAGIGKGESETPPNHVIQREYIVKRDDQQVGICSARRTFWRAIWASGFSIDHRRQSNPARQRLQTQQGYHLSNIDQQLQLGRTGLQSLHGSTGEGKSYSIADLRA